MKQSNKKNHNHTMENTVGWSKNRHRKEHEGDPA